MNPFRYIIEVVVFFLLLFIVSSNEYTDIADLDVVSSVQKYFHSGCITILYSSDKIQPDLLTFTSLHIFQSFFVKNYVMTAVLNTITLNTSLKDLKCRRNRPLYVIITCKEETKIVLEQDMSFYPSDGQVKFIKYFVIQIIWTHRVSHPRWLMFLDNSTAVEEFFRDINIPFDCEFLVAQRVSKEVLLLSEVYRVSGAHPLQKLLWGRWNSKDGLRGPSVSLYERRIDLQGFVFKAAAIHNPPYETLMDTKDGKLEADGAFSQLWFEIGRNLNYTTKVFRGASNTWGSLMSNGSWSGVMGMIINGEMDVGLSTFYMTSARSMVVDATMPMHMSKACVYIQTPDGSSTKWNAFLSPFSGDVWLTIGVFVLFLTVLLTLSHTVVRRLGNMKTCDLDTYNLYNSTQCVFGCFCSQGHWKTPNSLSCRFVFWISFITSTILMSAYSANFMADLTVNVVELPFEDLQGILEDDSYNFVVPQHSGLYTNFNNSSDALMQDIFRKKILPMSHKLPRTSLEGLQRVCEERLVFMTTLDFYMHFGDKVSCHLSLLPRASFPLYLTYILQKNSPFKRVVNYNLQKMYRSGVIKRLYYSKFYRKLPEYESELKSVDMDGATPILSVCAIGFVLCILTTLMEKRAILFKKRGIV